MASKKKRKSARVGPALSQEVCDQLERHLAAMQEAANLSGLSEEERRRAMLRALAPFAQIHFDLKGEPMSKDFQDALGITSD